MKLSAPLPPAPKNSIKVKVEGGYIYKRTPEREADYRRAIKSGEIIDLTGGL